MLYLFIFCGCAGAGKTTLSKVLTNEYQAIRLSFDEMECFKYSELLPHIIKSIRENKNVVVDALFSRTSQRKLILEATKGIDCKRILIYMNTPLGECIRRNVQRPNPLPEFMIRDIYNSVEFPTLDEGWDEIIVINNDEDIKNLENNIGNNIENLNLL